jgi:hypothetical protein
MAAGPVLTEASVITCTHPEPRGRIQITGSRRLTVAGAAVLTARGAAAITPCGQPANPPSTAPCGAVTVLGGSALRLQVDGVPVLLAATFAAVTTGIPPAMVPIGVPPPVPPPVPILVDAGQNLLRAE